MGATNNLNPAQFRFVVEQNGLTRHTVRYESGRMVESDDPIGHRITAYRGRTTLGHMTWSSGAGDITSITEPRFRGQGVATHLYNRAQEYSAEHGLTMPSADESVAVSPAGYGLRASLQHRQGPEPIYGQQPLIPRKGKNRTVEG